MHTHFEFQKSLQRTKTELFKQNLCYRARTTLMLVLLLTVSGSALGGPQAKSPEERKLEQPIDEVNSLTLRRVNVDWDRARTKGEHLFYKFSTQTTLDMEEIAVYVDESNRIRKHIDLSRSEEDSQISIYYYDANGELIFAIDSEGFESKYELNVYAICQANRILSAEQKLQEYDYANTTPDDKRVKVKIKSHHSGRYSDLPLGSISATTTKGLLEIYGLTLDDLVVKSEYPKVRFLKRNNDGRSVPTYVNRNGVKAYSAPDLDSEVIMEFDAGNLLDGIFVEQPDTSTPPQWFKAYDMYLVPTEYVEPSERTVAE